MNDLFDGVIYAGIDTDKHKYPIGKFLFLYVSNNNNVKKNVNSRHL